MRNLSWDFFKIFSHPNCGETRQHISEKLVVTFLVAEMFLVGVAAASVRWILLHKNPLIDIDLLCKIEAPGNMMYSRSFSIIHKTENQNDNHQC